MFTIQSIIHNQNGMLIIDLIELIYKFQIEEYYDEV